MAQQHNIGYAVPYY